MVGQLEMALSWPSFFHQPPTRLTARVNPTIHGTMLRIARGVGWWSVYSRVDPGGQPWGGCLCCLPVLWACAVYLCRLPVLFTCAVGLCCLPVLFTWAVGRMWGI